MQRPLVLPAFLPVCVAYVRMCAWVPSIGWGGEKERSRRKHRLSHRHRRTQPQINTDTDTDTDTATATDTDTDTDTDTGTGTVSQTNTPSVEQRRSACGVHFTSYDIRENILYTHAQSCLWCSLYRSENTFYVFFHIREHILYVHTKR
jgi:hypothetical protein